MEEQLAHTAPLQKPRFQEKTRFQVRFYSTDVQKIAYEREIFNKSGIEVASSIHLCYTIPVILNQCLNRPKIRMVTWKKEGLVGQIERCFAFWDLTKLSDER